MPEVGRVGGPSGPQESPGKKDPKIDSDTFKKVMRVDKVSEVDPEQKKKKRERAEEEEEELAAPQDEKTSVTPFTMDRGERRAAPVREMQLPDAPPSPTPPPPPLSSSAPPPPMQTEEVSQGWDQTSFLPPPPLPQGQSTPPPQPLSNTQQSSEETTTQRASTQKSEEKKETSESLLQEDREKLLKPSPSDKGEKKGDKEKKEKEEGVAVGVPTPPPPLAPASAKEKEKKGGEVEEVGVSTALRGGSMLLPEVKAVGGTPRVYLNPQVMELFEKMVGVITVMTASGIKETTITLNTPQFASSVFFGSQIIIREYSTAPKVFNVQLNGNSQALALFQGNASDLMAAFQYGNYNFRVNRLDTGVLAEARPEFHRKESLGGGSGDEQGKGKK